MELSPTPVWFMGHQREPAPSQRQQTPPQLWVWGVDGDLCHSDHFPRSGWGVGTGRYNVAPGCQETRQWLWALQSLLQGCHPAQIRDATYLAMSASPGQVQITLLLTLLLRLTGESCVLPTEALRAGREAPRDYHIQACVPGRRLRRGGPAELFPSLRGCLASFSRCGTCGKGRWWELGNQGRDM